MDKVLVDKSKNVKKILNIALPSASKYALDMAQVMVDLIFLGNISYIYLTVVGISTQLIMLVAAIAMTFSLGANYTLSRFKGMQDFNRIKIFLFNITLLTFLASLPLTYIFYTYTYEIFYMMSFSTNISQIADVYFAILALSIPAVLLDDVFFASCNALGISKISLKIKIASIILNIFLSYSLIYGVWGFPKLDIKGAAIATCIASYFALAVYFFIIFYKNSILSFSIGFLLEDIKRSLKIGFIATIERLSSMSALLLIIPLISVYGDRILAAYNTGLRIEGIYYMPGFGLMIATMSIVGMNIGANNPKKAYEDTILISKISFFIMGFIGLIIIFFPEFFINIFTNDNGTIYNTKIYLYCIIVSFPGLSCIFIFSAALRGLGRAKKALFINTFSIWFIRLLPMYIIYYLRLNVIYIYLIIAIETYIRGLIFYLAFKKDKIFT